MIQLFATSDADSFTEYFEGSNLTWVTMIERLRKFKIIIFEPIGEEVSYPKPIFYKGASACIIAFDKGDNTTFKKVKDWYDQIKENDLSLSFRLL